MNSGKVLPVIGLILGVVSVLGGFLVLVDLILPAFGLGCGILGTILSAVARKSESATVHASGIATAGLVISIIGLVISCLTFFACSFNDLLSCGCGVRESRNILDALQELILYEYNIIVTDTAVRIRRAAFRMLRGRSSQYGYR